MKHAYLFVILVSLISYTSLYALPTFELLLEPRWQDLDTNPATVQQFKSKLMWAGIIELKKRTAQQIKIEQLVLCWHGVPLEQLNGSLYVKDIDKKFLPIEDYLLCDSTWDSHKQSLCLSFERPLNLEQRTTLCLVLTVPIDLEVALRQGHFELEATSLPTLVQESLAKKPLTLALR